MKTDSILEIPVFGAHEQYFEQLSEPNNKTSEKKYADFLLKEYKLDDDHIIYFYCIDYIPETGNTSLVDQIIPKAPFVFFVLDTEKGMEEELTHQLMQKYSEIYSTPVFIILKKDDNKIENDPIIKANDFKIILIEEGEQDLIQTIVSQAIDSVIPANI